MNTANLSLICVTIVTSIYIITNAVLEYKLCNDSTPYEEDMEDEEEE